MDTMTWFMVGILAGMLLTLVVGEGEVLRDLVLGVLGISVGAWLFRQLGIQPPFGGLPGTVFMTFVGAAALRLVWQAARSVNWWGV